MTQNVFRRVEKKYLMDEAAYRALMLRIRPALIPDAFFTYTICNIYYDTEDDALVRNSIEKPAYKEKLRLRSYGIPKPEDKVFLEIKKKYDGVVYKRRTEFSLKEAERYLITGEHRGRDGLILHELDYFLSFYRPVPKLYLAYDRDAYTGREDRELRITLDTSIRSRTEALQLGAGDWGRELLPSGYRLMEVKTAAALPLWLVRALNECEIYPVSFSKYGNIYKKNMQEERSVRACV